MFSAGVSLSLGRKYESYILCAWASRYICGCEREVGEKGWLSGLTRHVLDSQAKQSLSALPAS